MQPPDYLADYLKLREANDQLRERGKQWLFETLDRLCAEANRQLSLQSDQPLIQIGYQQREFKADKATLVGEAMGVRFRMNTLLVETGWPRLPGHGFLTYQGLARARVSLSPNPTIDANLIDELILRQTESEVEWSVIRDGKIRETVTETTLRDYLQRVLAD
jgi:hypothetical protein